MGNAYHANERFAVDQEGFLVNMDDWNEEIAQELAAKM